MKVVILGPVITSETSGGVAVFDEGLYDGFKNNGHDASVISIVKSININNTFLSKKTGHFLFY